MAYNRIASDALIEGETRRPDLAGLASAALAGHEGGGRSSRDCCLLHQGGAWEALPGGCYY